jgi:hypothetical protein
MQMQMAHRMQRAKGKGKGRWAMAMAMAVELAEEARSQKPVLIPIPRWLLVVRSAEPPRLLYM